MGNKQSNRCKFFIASDIDFARFVKQVDKANIKYSIKPNQNQIIIFFPKHLEKNKVLLKLEDSLNQMHIEYERKY